MGIFRLNHAVLFVRDAQASVKFYSEVFGFTLMATEMNGNAAFMRAPNSENHHDLGLFTVGAAAPHPPRGSTGLYHLAWQVEKIEDLVVMRDKLSAHNALTGASDHGATKSLYGQDPDGNEFEVMFMIPRESWGDHETKAIIEPLDLDAEVKRWQTS